MTRDLEDLHQDVGMPAMRRGVSEMIDNMKGGIRPTSRRTFLMGAGAAAAGGAALMVIGGTPAMAGASTRELTSAKALEPSRRPASRVTWLWQQWPPAWRTWLCSPTRLASRLPGPASSAPCPRRWPHLPPRSRASTPSTPTAWNGVLKSNGKAKVTVTNPTLTPTVQADFAKVTDITGLAQLAITLETIAAQTYQAETSMLKSSAAIGLSSSIQPVEMQHIAILYYVLGMYPGAQTALGRRWRSTRPVGGSRECGHGTGRASCWLRAPCS